MRWIQRVNQAPSVAEPRRESPAGRRRVGPLLLCTCIALVLCAPAAHAQTGEREVVEMHSGPLLANTRIVGLSGAYASVAEGAGGLLENPASLPNRMQHTLDRRFAWSMALNLSVVRGGSGRDLDQSGLASQWDSSVLAFVALQLQFGRHAVGIAFSGVSLQFTDEVNGEGSFNQQLAGIGYGISTLGGRLDLGVFTLGAATSVETESIAETDTAFGLEVGALYKPRNQPWRLALAVRTPMRAETVADTSTGEPPPVLFAPGQVRFAGSYMFGPRNYNPAPSWGVSSRAHVAEGRSPEDLARGYTLLSASLEVTARSPNALGPSSWIAGSDLRAGTRITLSPRLGVESEVVDNLLIVRAGSHWDPSRYEGQGGRLHGTGGFDIRVPIGIDWKLSFAVDGAPRFFKFAFGFGIWR